MKKATVLDISRVESAYQFRVEEAERGAVQQRYTTPPISNQHLAELRRAIQQASRGQFGEFPLEDLGRLMYRRLLPREIQELLRNLNSPLLISTDAPEMPWELFYDDESSQFLGLTCAVGRRLVTDHLIQSGAEAPSQRPASFLLIGNPRGDLPGSQLEVERVSELALAAEASTRLLLGSRAVPLQVQLELGRDDGYTVIHYSGHADQDSQSKQPVLLLAPRSKLTAHDIQSALRGNPFVFLNGCGTDRASTDGRRPAPSLQVTDGLAAAFIQSGARCVIGTRWEVDDTGAAELAAMFYEAALTGLPIGESLRQAKLRFREQYPNDATWAAFVLYGDPCLTLIEPPRQEAVPEPVAAQTGRAPDATIGPLTDAEDAREVWKVALAEARMRGVPGIDTPFLVIGLTKATGGVTEAGLRRQGISPKRLRDIIRMGLPTVGPPLPAQDDEPRSPRVQEIAGHAREAAVTEGAEQITERHLLIGFLQTPAGATRNFLRRAGVDLDALLAFAMDPSAAEEPPANAPDDPPAISPDQFRENAARYGRGDRRGGPGGGGTGGSSGSGTPLLDQLGRDLTREAREGRLKPVIGRRDEMSRVAQIMARTDKNNAMILGDPGVGKTAVVEGLAQRIAEDRVPDHLRGKRIVELPMASIVSGTMYRGDLEQRLTGIIREASQPEIILFIDEIHLLVGAGKGEGAMDAANILKPALARGDIRCIGATTYAEFRRSIEKDAALDRRFQRVVVNEPSPEDTMTILQRTRERFETHHHVRLADEALDAALALSLAYLPDRRLPDKACDLIDEACARARVGSLSKWSTGGGAPAAGGDTPLVTADTVAAVLAEWTGIPITRLTEAEQARLLKLEDRLRERVVGQEAAVSALAEAVRLSRAGLRKENRPVGVFLFVGPSGVGKTEMAKALAEVLHGSERAMVRLDMSELTEAHNVARLVGSPPGYRDSEQEGQLTGALRRRPSCVVLLDEIEKAHPQVFDLFLQLFDDGRITDAQGRLADGRNAIFIMTSNLAAEVVERRQTMGFQSRLAGADTFRQELMAELRKTFRPELLGRLDDVIIFGPLPASEVWLIAKRQIEHLAARVAEQHELTVEVDKDALGLIAERGYSDKYGVRPLERLIERTIGRPLSQLVLAGARGAMRIVVENGELHARHEP